MWDAIISLIYHQSCRNYLAAARKQREQQARSVVDGRSLRAKGRTEQLNVKVRPDIKQALAEHVEAEGVTIADWLERMLETALARARVPA